MTMPEHGSRSEAIRSGLIAQVEADLRSDGTAPSSRAGDGARSKAKSSEHLRPRRAIWATAVALVLVGGVTAAVYASALNGGGNKVAAPSTPSDTPTPSGIPTPAADYPVLPDGRAPFTDDALGTCRSDAGLYPMGQLAIDSNTQNLPQVAYNDLAAYLLTDFPDQLAATGGGYGTTGLQIVPATEGADIQAMFDLAVTQLHPQFQSLVSFAGLTVLDPVGYSFEDACRAYTDAKYLAEQASQDPRLASPWFSLSLSPFDARVALDVPHDVPPAIREMEANYGSIVQVTVMPKGYKGGTLTSATIAPADIYTECTLELMQQIRDTLAGSVVAVGYLTSCTSAGHAEITVQPGLGQAASDLLEPFGPIVEVVEAEGRFGYNDGR